MVEEVIPILTFQDFTKTTDKAAFISKLIQEHRQSRAVKIARRADKYDRQQNVTICTYVQKLFSLTGEPLVDFTASNNKIASNFFNRLNTQRCTYSLGNGVTFTRKETRTDEDGNRVTVDLTKEQLGSRFDTDLKKGGYLALIHGVSFLFWNVDRLHVFPLTEFAPLWDEETGTLRAGVRYWQLDDDHPTIAILYEEDGYTRYRAEGDGGANFSVAEKKRAYRQTVSAEGADGVPEVVGEENYSGKLPIVPLYGSRLRQSTLIGMQHAIDSFDLIRSGFANDLTDCSQIYWIVENCGGVDDADLARFRDRLKLNHIANVDGDDAKVTPYTQEPPYQARKEYLDHIRAGIYEDFGGLDVHTVAAGATNDHIDAAYQPMDENADDFEYQIIEAVQQILALIGIEDTPIFKRNRISNQKEQVEMVLMEAPYLDDETILNKLPNITPDEVVRILAAKEAEDLDRLGDEEPPEDVIDDV